MSLKAETYAVNKMYAKLIKQLPVEEMLPALISASVITDGQKEKISAMKSDKERATFLLDKVIIVNLKCESRDVFDNFIEVLKEDENPINKKLFEDLNSLLAGRPPLQKHNTHPFTGPPLSGEIPQAQPPYAQPFYAQPFQTQAPYGQLPQTQPLQTQIPYGQPPQMQPPYGQQFQTQVPYDQPPQRRISRQTSYPFPEQPQYVYSPQSLVSPQIQSPHDQFAYGQQLFNPAYSQPLQGQIQGGPQQVKSYYSQSQSQQQLFQPQPPSFIDAFSQQNLQMSLNPSGNPPYQVNPTSELPQQHENTDQQNCSQPAVATENELNTRDPEITEVQWQSSSKYPPQDETTQKPNNLPKEEDVVDFHENPEETPKVLDSNNLPKEEDIVDFHENPEETPKVLDIPVDRPSQEETVDEQFPKNDQPQKEIPMALQSPVDHPSQEEIIDVQTPENDRLKKEIPKVLQSPLDHPSQEEIIGLQTSANDQTQNKIPKVLQSPIDHPSQEETIDEQFSKNNQPQKEIPKVLQCPGDYPSQEEIIGLQASANDQAQNEIPKVLQSPGDYPSQEEIIRLQTSANDQPQKEIPKVLQSPVDHLPQEEVVGFQTSTNDQPQKEIPKVLQSPVDCPSQEEIIGFQTSANDRPQKEIPKVLQSPVDHPSQEEIIGFQTSANDQAHKELPKVSQNAVNNSSPEEIKDVQPSSCLSNKVLQLEGNSAVNVPQQSFEACKAVAGHKEGEKMHQQKAKETMQVMEWISCMKSVCRIESKCKGTGVIGYFTIQGSLQYVLLTCHHVIPTKDDAKNAYLYFGYTDGCKNPTACPASSILDTSGQWFWTDPTYRDLVKKKYGLNYSMLKIKKSELDKIKFSGISQLMNIQGVKMSDENDPIKEKDFLMLMAQTPHLNVTYGNCTGNPSTAIIKYDIATIQGSAGSPVFKQEAGRSPYMVAIHNGYAETKNHGVNIYMDYGVRLMEILNHFNGKPSLPMPPSGFTYKQE